MRMPNWSYPDAHALIVAAMAPSPRAQLAAVAKDISALLPAWIAIPTEITSADYFYESRNGLAVIRLDLHPQLRGLVDRERGLFAHEHTVMVMLERDSKEALMWDKGGYDDPEFLGEFGVAHYLCDLARQDDITTAISAQDPVGSDLRRSMLAVMRTRQALGA